MSEINVITNNILLLFTGYFHFWIGLYSRYLLLDWHLPDFAVSFVASDRAGQLMPSSLIATWSLVTVWNYHHSSGWHQHKQRSKSTRITENTCVRVQIFIDICLLTQISATSVATRQQCLGPVETGSRIFMLCFCRTEFCVASVWWTPMLRQFSS